MSSALDDYKALIDGLVAIRPCVVARRVSERRAWPDLPENAVVNEFVASLRDEQRGVLSRLLQESREGGIHDALAFLNEAINCRGYRLVREGRELPVEPFGTELHYDWVCRREGDAWPASGGDES
jgi:hypothetical protein